MVEYRKKQKVHINMSIKSISLLILLATAVLLSGCISDKDGNKVNNTIVINNSTINTTESGLFPKTNLPSGYSFETIHETKVEIGNSSFDATEGIYRYNNGYAEVQAIKNENPANLIDLYMSKYKEANYNPFEEISFNDHKATIVTDYITKSGKQVPKYTVIWTKGTYMFIVFNEEPTDSKTVVTFATASGN
jgi:hypothetical protein